MSAQEQALGQICIQVQPLRASGLSLERFTQACEAVARSTVGVRGFGAAQGEDDGAFLNATFATEDPLHSWPKLREALLDSEEFGQSLREACICVCTRNGTWDDYLLLHHFDSTIPPDATAEV
jgi:hypothetical protein